ncbi:MAG: glycosyltransferase [Nitrospira sp. CR1.3]|nr:glycosyltransferase [Nitrospira sp. CR1.3]
MAQRLIGQGVHEKTVRVIHNWADGSRIHPINRDQNPLRSEWGLNGKFVVGYSGNFGRAHDFTTILDAAERLKGNGHIVFLFIGSGAQRGQLEKETQRRELQNVRFKPYQPRKRLHLSLSVPDAHLVSLQPSLEGFIVPSKFYGIAAAGRPTIFIGSSQGEIPRILKEAQCGFSIEVGRVDELVGIIQNLAAHEELCLCLGRRARELFDRRFDVGYAMHAWDEVLGRSA